MGKMNCFSSVFKLFLGVLILMLFSCAGAGNGTDVDVYEELMEGESNTDERENQPEQEDLVYDDEDIYGGDIYDGDVAEELDIHEDIPVDKVEGCTTIDELRATPDGPVNMDICPAFVTYVSYLGYFLQVHQEGPAIMVYEGTSWVPDVRVGDEITMHVTSLTTYYGTKEINGHNEVTILSSGNDVDALTQNISSGVLPSEELESEIVRIEGGIVTGVDGRNMTVSYGSATDVSVIPDDSGILCEGATFSLKAIVAEQSNISAYIIKSYNSSDFYSISVSSCMHGGREPGPGDLLINEFLFDPPDGIDGDANCDGVRNANDDEFIEVVNVSTDLISLAGVTISDRVAVRHTFWPGTILEPGKAIVVFGGGSPSCSFWATGDIAVKSSRGGLYLDIGGDTITLALNSSMVISVASYSASVVFDQSLTLNPDLNDTDPDPVNVGGFVGHWGADSIDHTLFSPGTRIDGSAF